MTVDDDGREGGGTVLPEQRGSVASGGVRSGPLRGPSGCGGAGNSGVKTAPHPGAARGNDTSGGTDGIPRESGGGEVSWSGSQGSADMAATDGGLDYGDDDGSGMDLTTHVTAWVGLAPTPGDEGGVG